MRNFEIWPAPGSTDLGGGWFPNDPRSSQIGSYEDELILTENWIRDRMLWLDENIPLLTSLAENELKIPTTFELMQNYPNPFNPSTAISYQIPTLSQVELTVYNALGQKVRTLVKETQSVGTYTLQFDAQKLNSGLYYYQLKVNGYTINKKMLLLK